VSENKVYKLTLSVYNKVRHIWDINPKTRVKKNKKRYDRQRDKKKVERERA